MVIVKFKPNLSLSVTAEKKEKTGTTLTAFPFSQATFVIDMTSPIVAANCFLNFLPQSEIKLGLRPRGRRQMEK